MKKIMGSVLLSALTLTASAGGPEIPMMLPGIYVGLAGSWTTLDESFHSVFYTSTTDSAWDHYDTSRNRLAPMAQIGYWRPISSSGLWGISAQWKYLGYKTPNVDSNLGQHLTDATFSSINIFGPNVMRDFSSQTRVNHEVMLLAYWGMLFNRSYAYLGLGPAIFTTFNSIFVTAVHVSAPGSRSDNLIPTSVTQSKTIWAGAAQIGYNYYLQPTSFLSFSYTYLQSGTNHFSNLVNTALLNGGGIPGPNTVNISRTMSLTVQEIMFSVNKVFAI